MSCVVQMTRMWKRVNKCLLWKWGKNCYIFKIENQISGSWPWSPWFFALLTLSHLQIFASDDFWKHCCKKKKYSFTQKSFIQERYFHILSFSIVFPTCFLRHLLQICCKWVRLALNFPETILDSFTQRSCNWILVSMKPSKLITMENNESNKKEDMNTFILI